MSSPAAFDPISLSLIVPCVTGFTLSLILFPPFIGWLKRRQVEQFVREEGPKSHSFKARTPTTGGVCFIAGSVLSSVIWLGLWRALTFPVAAVVLAALGCGLIGLLDDLAKVKRKTNQGISGRLRLALEFAIGLLLGIALLKSVPPELVVSGMQTILANGGQVTTAAMPTVGYLLLASFLLAATANAINLHDGMDGLAGGTSLLVLMAMSYMLLVSGQWPLAAIAASLVGSLLSFLVFNRFPAKIFMGDTGSLFIGAMMASLAVAGRLELWFIPLAAIYILETLSVILQVGYFKLTKEYRPETPMSWWSLAWLKLTRRCPGEGKRLFIMAPLHHHFEAIGQSRGVSEWQVVVGFWIAQIVVCLLVISVFQLV